jgi:molybdopterin adenylyltransferase
LSSPEQSRIYSCGILTISDKGARGERQDTSGPNLKAIMASHGFAVNWYDIVPDEERIIEKTLITWIDELHVDLVITTGGTGVAPTDVTPEATRRIIDREIPGIAEAMRLASMQKTPNAILSRGIAGIRKESLIINLPGSKKAAAENIEAVLAAIPHALDKIKGNPAECGG